MSDKTLAENMIDLLPPAFDRAEAKGALAERKRIVKLAREQVTFRVGDKVRRVSEHTLATGSKPLHGATVTVTRVRENAEGWTCLAFAEARGKGCNWHACFYEPVPRTKAQAPSLPATLVANGNDHRWGDLTVTASYGNLALDQGTAKLLLDPGQEEHLRQILNQRAFAAVDRV